MTHVLFKHRGGITSFSNCANRFCVPHRCCRRPSASGLFSGGYVLLTTKAPSWVIILYKKCSWKGLIIGEFSILEASLATCAFFQATYITITILSYLKWQGSDGWWRQRPSFRWMYVLEIAAAWPNLAQKTHRIYFLKKITWMCLHSPDPRVELRGALNLLKVNGE